MKLVILAGGLGTRISEESHLKPKPMIEIGGKPILWHIMKMYSNYGINDFVICLGYKGYVIKEYFSNYFLHSSDITISLRDNSTEIHQKFSEPWKITLIDTGDLTSTGGRLKRVQKYLNSTEPFCFTYGDGVSDIDISSLIKHHKSSGLLATITAIQPPGRYGALKIEDKLVKKFNEKPLGDGAWINGGFFVLEPKVLDLIDGDETVWEERPLQKLAEQGQLTAYQHHGFWQAMDTLREKNLLESLWASGAPPWKSWDV